jgi:hypothetical protein
MAQPQRIGRWAFALSGVLGLSASAGAQTHLQQTPGQIPQGSPFNNSRTENVDFGDVDLDGDFDVVMADGGDCCNDQNRIWINQGGAQAGTIGFYTDETATQFPAILDQGRDIEFVDFDNDGDLDVYDSNTSQTQNQTNRWFTNQGGLQGGTMGFYTDETLTRWLGLNSPSSSLAANQILGSGGFIDFSCDCDFADLDNDGDLDLVHSSYGGAFGGQIPTRLFLNDGLGFFTEHNPSGFKLAGATIVAGNPSIWVEGTHQSNTTNSTGVNADVASSALDIDVGDVDGDWDFDILHGARQEAPRFFTSRLAQTGSLIWRDTTGAVYPAGYTSGNGHYEQEFGDFDSDDDLDIYGLNWFNNFTDETLRNNGAGVFTNLTTLPGSAADDNEGDFGDYDDDGDLDLYVANFSGNDKMYQNMLVENGSFSYVAANTTIGSVGGTALDADWGDIDNDGDYDILVGRDGNAANILLKNIHNNPDSHAPRIPLVEDAPDRIAGVAPTVVRAQIYDNAAYYVTWYNPTTVEYRVNGGSLTSIPAHSSQGQIFRAEIPGTLVGFVEYRFISSDRSGNTTTSGFFNYNGAPNNCNAVTYCAQVKVTSVAGCTAVMTVPDCSVATGVWTTTNIPRDATAGVGTSLGIYIYTDGVGIGQSAFSSNIPFGTLCLAGFKRSSPTCAPATVPSAQPGVCNAGPMTTSVNCNAGALGIVAGEDVNVQLWYRDPTPGGNAANFSNAVFYTAQ